MKSALYLSSHYQPSHLGATQLCSGLRREPKLPLHHLWTAPILTKHNCTVGCLRTPPRAF